ncbi:EAL domain-containing protein [Tahibacter amnicola]|uniref:EAL domain-containing protein n=1 Tax=Tahibacter amnicola TaxID=2976241 RepID=A0ABY6BGV2_9GAMM|nr:EAL domain-containing protein [Tahibacter amnicola]UXI67092.1 EAL domain-containing protein [Tahibacter amnicola]
MNHGDQPRTSDSAADTAAADALVAALDEIIARGGADGPLLQTLALARSTLQELEHSTDSVAARYRSLINAVPDAVTLHDEEGRIIDANEAACRIYGHSLEQLRQMTVYDLNPDLPSGRMREVLSNFLPGHTVTVETTNQRADGTRFPVEVHSNVYIDGEARRIVAVARDITHRREADKELRASEARYRALLQAVDKGVMVQDAHGTILSVNPAGCRLLGLTETELTRSEPQMLRDWRFEDERGQPLPFPELPAMRALRLGTAIESTLVGVWLPHLRLYRWFNISTVPQFLPGCEEPFQVISTYSDVTALKRASELFDKTQALASIGGWEYDPGEEQLFWTEEMYRIHDLPNGSTVSVTRALSFFSDDDRTRMQQAMAAAKSGQPFDLELPMTSAIGRRRWVRIQGAPLFRHGQIHGVGGTLQDITDRKLNEEELKRQARTDVLTGLANRGCLIGEIEKAIAAARPYRGPSVLYVDLDRFKVVNDMLGHAAGDVLLTAAAERLRSIAADQAFAARFAGDAFVLLLPSLDDTGVAQRLAERVTTAFTEPFRHADEELVVTVSVGIARYPEDGTTAQQLINHADAAVHEAKRRGRNTWQMFNPVLARNLSDRLLIESQLRRALENGEFHLEYQPTIELATNRIVAAEALLRWNNRHLGRIGPAAFIPHAENSGDIVPIGAWVIREACRQLRAWRNAGLPVLRIATNVSYRQFLNESLAETVRAALNEFDIAGASLELEMTERVLIDDIPDTQDTLAALRGFGVCLTIDDFGEGYSALNYLRRLPIDGIKISHTFMQGIPTHRADSAICDAIIRIAQGLGLSVTAEGVENEDQQRFLVDRGTPLAQGHLFSQPLPAAAFAEFFTQWNTRRPER